LLFTDIADSSRMNRALGNALYAERLRQPHNAYLRDVLEAHAGFEVKTIGDSFLVAFQSVDAALACAVAMQQRLAASPLTAEDSEGKIHTVAVRMGIHTAIKEMQPEIGADGRADYLGEDVNFAARVESLGSSAQILVSEETYRAAGSRQRYLWQEWPNRYIKSFENAPETVYELQWDGTSQGEPGTRWLPDWYARELNKFVGREALLDAIRDWLRNGKTPLLTLHGYGGIGKTRLAVETVLSICGLFAGGVAFLPLDQEPWSDPAQVTAGQLAEAIARILDALDDIVQNAETQLLSYLQKSQPTLLVLDNWETAANAQTLRWLGDLLSKLRAVRCLVTSRLAMGLSNLGVNREIPPLDIPRSEQDALETSEGYRLFVERARQRQPEYPLDDHAALRGILQATAGWPLGIELVAARLEDCSLREIADGLEQSLLDWQRTSEDLGDVRADTERHNSMETCLDWSVRLLPAEEQAAFPRLSVFAHDFSPQSAEAICGVSADQLRRWRRAALLERLEISGETRYALLPVAREYAGRKLESTASVPFDVATLRQNFVAHYRQIAEDNDDINNLSKLAKLDAEWRNILTAAETAQAQGEWQSVVIISRYLGDFLQIRGRWSEREYLILSALAAARVAEDRQAEGRVLNNLGSVYYRQGRWQEVIACYEQSLAIFREYGDQQGEGKILNNLGEVYRAQGRWKEAIEHYEQDVAICREYSDRVGEGATLNNLGLVYQAQGRWQEAIACYEQCLAICREYDDRLGEGKILNNLGEVYRAQGRWQEAIARYEQSLAIFREYDDRLGEGTPLMNLGNIYQAQGRWQEAIACYEQSLAICREYDDRLGEGKILNNLGEVYRAQGWWQEAIVCYDRSLVIEREYGDRIGEGLTLENVALLREAQGDIAGALEWGRQALQVLETTQDKRATEKVRGLVARWEQSKGR
jgi:tetratricopeptide (TPR) repeat protein/class 3 adenylate cyclase